MISNLVIVNLSNNREEEIDVWLQKNCYKSYVKSATYTYSQYGIVYGAYRFSCNEDALFFKLTWS